MAIILNNDWQARSTLNRGCSDQSTIDCRGGSIGFAMLVEIADYPICQWSKTWNLWWDIDSSGAFSGHTFTWIFEFEVDQSGAGERVSDWVIEYDMEQYWRNSPRNKGSIEIWMGQVFEMSDVLWAKRSFEPDVPIHLWVPTSFFSWKWPSSSKPREQSTTTQTLKMEKRTLSPSFFYPLLKVSNSRRYWSVKKGKIHGLVGLVH